MFILQKLFVFCLALMILMRSVTCSNIEAILPTKRSPRPTSTTSSTLCSLPPVTEWTHYPIYIEADNRSTQILRNNENGGLPLGVPIPFKSELFQGHIVIRFAPTQEESSSIENHPQKWRWQYTIQGKFQQEVPMDELYMGEVYDQPLVNMPPSFVMQGVRRLFALLVPGVDFQVDSPTRPRVLSLLGGTMKTIRIDLPGQEPAIVENDTATLIEESTSILSSSFSTSAARQSLLRRPNRASQYVFDTQHVYTFQHDDAVLDYRTYQAHLAPGFTIDLTQHFALGQAMSMGVLTKEGRWMFRVRVWNERAVGKAVDLCPEQYDRVIATR